MSEYKNKTKKLKDQSKRVGLDNTADIKRIHKSLADVYIKIEQSLKDKNTQATKENTKHFLELNKNIVALNKIFEDGLTINNLSDIKQAEDIIVKNLKDIPREVTVKNQTEIPRWLASDESVKSLSESIEKVVSQLVDLEATIKPSQDPDKFIPMRRVIRQGNNLIYDDSDWASRSGGGSSNGLTDDQLRETAVEVSSTDIVDAINDIPLDNQNSILEEVRSAIQSIASTRGIAADLRVTILGGTTAVTGTLTAVTTVTTVTTVATLSNITNIGGITATGLVPSNQNTVAVLSNINNVV